MTIGIIPGRMKASRFPGKPLADIHGIPMIGHCYLRSRGAKSLDDLVIATCDGVICDYADFNRCAVHDDITGSPKRIGSYRGSHDTP